MAQRRKHRKSTKSPIYYGVYMNLCGTYSCTIKVSKKTLYLGSGTDQLMLAKLYDDKIKELGLGRRLNFPDYPKNDIPNTKLIQLTKGKFAIVDDKNFEWLNKFKWHAIRGTNTYYAIRHNNVGGKRNNIFMHQLIVGNNTLKLLTDHWDGNGLNNQESNLRSCTSTENNRNQRNRIGYTSIYKGVSWSKQNNGWLASINVKGKAVHRKFFKNEIDAAIQYDIWAKELFREFAKTNF